MLINPKALVQPKSALNNCAYLFFLLEIPLDCVVSVKTSVLIYLYLSWLSFVLNFLDKETLAIVIVHHLVVDQIVILIALIPIPKFYTSTSGVTPERFLLSIFPLTWLTICPHKMLYYYWKYTKRSYSDGTCSTINS